MSPLSKVTVTRFERPRVLTSVETTCRVNGLADTFDFFGSSAGAAAVLIILSFAQIRALHAEMSPVWSICLYCLFIALGRTYFALGVYGVRDNLFLTKFYVTTCEGSVSSTYFSYFVKCILCVCRILQFKSQDRPLQVTHLPRTHTDIAGRPRLLR
jgi:hypothetical protein